MAHSAASFIPAAEEKSPFVEIQSIDNQLAFLYKQKLSLQAVSFYDEKSAPEAEQVRRLDDEIIELELQSADFLQSIAELERKLTPINEELKKYPGTIQNLPTYSEKSAKGRLKNEKKELQEKIKLLQDQKAYSQDKINQKKILRQQICDTLEARNYASKVARIALTHVEREIQQLEVDKFFEFQRAFFNQYDFAKVIDLLNEYLEHLKSEVNKDKETADELGDRLQGRSLYDFFQERENRQGLLIYKDTLYALKKAQIVQRLLDAFQFKGGRLIYPEERMKNFENILEEKSGVKTKTNEQFLCSTRKPGGKFLRLFKNVGMMEKLGAIKIIFARARQSLSAQQAASALTPGISSNRES